MGHDSAKRLAATLRQAMKGYGCALKHGQALDTVSKLLGSADWNTLAARLTAVAEAQEPADTTCCGRCGSPLLNGYCTDGTCPHSDWPQSVNIDAVYDKTADAVFRDLGIRKRIRVRAEVYSDDMLYVTGFDCDAWFEQASDEDIMGLAKIGWRGDYAADTVAEFFEGKIDLITEMFAYCRRTQGRANPVGYEVMVFPEQARRWLRWHRPGVLALLLCEEHDVSLVEAQEPEIQGMWDWLGPHGEACDISWDTEQEAAINAADVLQLWPEA